MRKEILLLLLVCIITSVKAQDSLSKEESMTKINSILRSQHAKDSLFVFVYIDNPGMPEDWYAYCKIDTTKGILIESTSYIYDGRFKYLTNYSYWNNKLISTQTFKILIKNQSSEKYINWERSGYFWNDSLIQSYSTDNEHFDFNRQLRIGKEIMRQFLSLYNRKKIYFDKGSNRGYFKDI